MFGYSPPNEEKQKNERIELHAVFDAPQKVVCELAVKFPSTDMRDNFFHALGEPEKLSSFYDLQYARDVSYPCASSRMRNTDDDRALYFPAFVAPTGELTVIFPSTAMKKNFKDLFLKDVIDELQPALDSATSPAHLSFKQTSHLQNYQTFAWINATACEINRCTLSIQNNEGNNCSLRELSSYFLPVPPYGGVGALPGDNSEQKAASALAAIRVEAAQRLKQLTNELLEASQPQDGGVISAMLEYTSGHELPLAELLAKALDGREDLVANYLGVNKSGIEWAMHVREGKGRGPWDIETSKGGNLAHRLVNEVNNNAPFREIALQIRAFREIEEFFLFPSAGQDGSRAVVKLSALQKKMDEIDNKIRERLGSFSCWDMFWEMVYSFAACVSDSIAKQRQESQQRYHTSRFWSAEVRASNKYRENNPMLPWIEKANSLLEWENFLPMASFPLFLS
ncbi:MAG: hypothetical protein K0S27_1065 [Gammaproteobacteria bacterium]|nr:hypothetical protein [Gammaproteobacteria bacterium]